MDVLSSLGINPGYLLMQIALFVTFVVLLYHFLYKPILTTLDERRARIAKGLEDARQAAVARDNADAEAKTILDRARAEAAEVRQRAMEEAEERGKGVVRQAEEEAREIVEEAREDAAAERNRILADLRSQVVSIAIAATNKLIQDSLDAERQRALISDYLAKPPAEVSGLEGDRAVITSALPLTEKEQSQIDKMLAVDEVEFRVDPSILGGLIVRVGDQVVDDSVSYQMGALRETLA
jgi:F-type H+-transporting ATPase subunit b